jgi:choline dehydrogenase-like flavoprotein
MVNPVETPLRRKSAPDPETYDVIVVGAGASGIPAAIAAARQGARVALLEEDTEPGGAPLDSYVTLLCGGPRVGIFAMHLAPRIGIRESRRVMGEAVVTATDLLAGRFPDDTIACCEFFLDAWGEHDKLPRTPVSAGIPYRALIPRATEGLLVTGKAMSGTHLAMCAYRVQPIMASCGTAAGIAAALAARQDTGVRSINVGELQRRLRAMGVIV